MVETVEQEAGQRPHQLLADSGYCSEQKLAHLQKEKVEAYIATNRQEHSGRRVRCERRPLSAGATRVDQMRRKLQTKAGAEVYTVRKAIVEPLFGKIKQAWGFGKILPCGTEKVKAKWARIHMTHNILKMYCFCYG